MRWYGGFLAGRLSARQEGGLKDFFYYLVCGPQELSGKFFVGQLLRCFEEARVMDLDLPDNSLFKQFINKGLELIALWWRWSIEKNDNLQIYFFQLFCLGPKLWQCGPLQEIIYKVLDKVGIGPKKIGN